MDFDVLLGTDILPKMNINLTRVAVKWDDVQILEEDEKFKNINFMESKNEPNKSPYGTSSQYKRFMNEIEPHVRNNQNIPITSFCTIPESVVRLPTKEGAIAYQRQYPIPYKMRPITIDDFGLSISSIRFPISPRFTYKDLLTKYHASNL